MRCRGEGGGLDWSGIHIRPARRPRLARFGRWRHDEDMQTISGSSTLIWLDDRAWLVFTDHGGFPTFVSGGASLIDRLESDDALEAVRGGADADRHPRDRARATPTRGGTRTERRSE
jgi:hypothetical protein